MEGEREREMEGGREGRKEGEGGGEGEREQGELWMCVCIHDCVCVGVCLHTCVCVCVCLHTCVCAHLWVHLRECLCESERQRIEQKEPILSCKRTCNMICDSIPLLLLPESAMPTIGGSGVCEISSTAPQITLPLTSNRIGPPLSSKTESALASPA